MTKVAVSTIKVQYGPMDAWRWRATSYNGTPVCESSVHQFWNLEAAAAEEGCGAIRSDAAMEMLPQSKPELRFLKTMWDMLPLGWSLARNVEDGWAVTDQHGDVRCFGTPEQVSFAMTQDHAEPERVR